MRYNSRMAKASILLATLLLFSVQVFAAEISDAEKIKQFEAAVAEKMQAQAKEWDALSDREKIERMQKAVADGVDWNAMTDAEKRNWRKAAAKNAQLSDAERVRQIEKAIAKKLKQQAQDWEKLTGAEKLSKLEAQLRLSK